MARVRLGCVAPAPGWLIDSISLQGLDGTGGRLILCYGLIIGGCQHPCDLDIRRCSVPGAQISGPGMNSVTNTCSEIHIHLYGGDINLNSIASMQVLWYLP